jgi:isocitrate dehydrogenase kinase/phosphatase
MQNLTAPHTPAADALAAAGIIRSGFARFNASFRAVTQRAKARFEARAWAESRNDAVERIGLYDLAIEETSQLLRAALLHFVSDKTTWAAVKGHYSALIAPDLDQELYKTFFNTLTRRFFKTRGVDSGVEFVALDIEPSDRITRPVARLSYTASASLRTLFRSVLDDAGFAVGYSDPERCATRIAQALSVQLAHWGDQPVRAIELLTTVFYRERRAYLVGRVFGEEHFSPIAIALKNEDGADAGGNRLDHGIRADAVLTHRDDVAALFGYTRSYFQADLETVGDAVVFLRTLLPRKPIDELYTVLGRAKQGKTERYRHFFRHLEARDDRFKLAEGEKGMVMAVFTLPSYPLVFKVIRDKFAPPKNIVRQDVLEKYQLVFKHDRAGRLVDAQEFRYLKFPRARFAPDALKELIDTCASSVIAEGDYIVLTHLYVERRIRPLNLYVKEVPEELAVAAMVDYGQALKDLAYSNVFAGDLLLKNFGVTKGGRVIFYDYDELCFVTECRFRELPTQSDDDDGREIYVAPNDLFPEEFPRFLGLTPAMHKGLMDAHSDVFTPRWWVDVQKQVAAGVRREIPPYSLALRFADSLCTG